jgi:hypothetical protein
MSGFSKGFTVGNFGSASSGFGVGFSSTTASDILVGLVLRYDINNAVSYPGSGTAVTDLQSNSNATLTGGPTYSSSYLAFDGINDALITDTSLASKVTSDVTSIMMWAYPMDNGVLLSEVGTAALPGGSWHDAQIEMVAGTMKFGMWNSAAISSITSTVTTPLNSWYHFTIVYDGTKLNAYVNGAAAGSVTFARQNPIEVGAGLHYAIAATDSTNMGDGTYTNMRLGEFRVYSTALSTTDVQQVFNATKTRFGL